MAEKIWDLKAEGGPKLIDVGNATEAINIDPSRYSRSGPAPEPEADPVPEPEPQPEPAPAAESDTTNPEA